MSKKALSIFYAIFGIALLSMLGSLYFSEIAHLPPCTLCWYQRIAMYPIVVLAAVAAFREDVKAHFYILPLAIAGWLIAVFHNLLYYGIIPESAAPCSLGISCTTETIMWLGFITLPLLSLLSFTAIIAGMWYFTKLRD